jgi:hypothetical protein
MTSNAEIEKLAYELWEKDGRQHGRDQEYYLAAERLLAQGGNGVAVAQAAPKKRATAVADKPKATKTAKTTSTRTKKQA